MADAEHRDNAAVAFGLDEHSLARVDQQYRRLSRRCASRHISGVLFVARGISDDEAAPGRGKEAVGDVDRDALLSFGLQSVNQQCEVQALALSAEFLGI